MSNTRSVSFFRLTLDRRDEYTKRNGERATSLESLKEEDLFDKFMQIYNALPLATENRRAVKVAFNNGIALIVFYKLDGKKVYVKIGRPSPANTFDMYDKKTLITAPLPLSETQELELYTYALIDFENGIVSYIGISGAPKVNAIKVLFDEKLKDEKIEACMSLIATPDLLAILEKRDIISKIDIQIAIPSDDVIAKELGSPLKTFESIENINYFTQSYTITARRNRGLFKDNSGIATLYNELKEKYGDRLKKLMVRSRDLGGAYSGRPVDVLKGVFTAQAELKHSKDHDKLSEEDFTEALLNTYTSHRRELERYIR